MKKSKYTLAGASLLLAGFAAIGGVQAHHSLAGEFDVNTDFDLRGTVTELEWLNPHIWIYLDVAKEDGSIEKWQCEMGSPNQLIRAGWKKEDLPIGTIIRTTANPARDGSNTCSTRALTLDDGTPVFSRFGNR